MGWEGLKDRAQGEGRDYFGQKVIHCITHCEIFLYVTVCVPGLSDVHLFGARIGN